jgi:hypothetical protein
MSCSGVLGFLRRRFLSFLMWLFVLGGLDGASSSGGIVLRDNCLDWPQTDRENPASRLSGVGYRKRRLIN